MVDLLPWFIVAACIVAEAFFAAAELSIIASDPALLERGVDDGRASAQKVVWFRANPDRLFGTTLIGTNLSMVTGATVASLTLMKTDPVHGGAWAMLILSPLVLIGGEIVPKSFAQARANDVAEWLVWPLTLVQRLLAPAVWLTGAYTRLLYRTLRIDPNDDQPVSREELALALEGQAAEEGDMDFESRKMIARIFTFSRLAARDSMVPLVEMVGISQQATVRDATELIHRHGYSRLPVFGTRIDDVVGILHHLDLLAATAPDQCVAELMRPAYFVPERQDIDEILLMLRREAASAAIVVDEFGGAVGLLTLEDVIEEIVGDIEDEFDPTVGLWRPNDGGWIVAGRAPIDALNAALGLALPESPEYETIAGLMLDRLRLIPAVGASLRLDDGARIQVRRASERAIIEVVLMPPPAA